MFRNDPHHRFRGKIHEQIAYSIVERNPTPALHITNIVIHHYGYEEQLVIQKIKSAGILTFDAIASGGTP